MTRFIAIAALVAGVAAQADDRHPPAMWAPTAEVGSSAVAGETGDRPKPLARSGWRGGQSRLADRPTEIRQPVEAPVLETAGVGTR